MKCYCELLINGTIDPVCDKHKELVELRVASLRDELGRVKRDNELLYGLVEIKKIVEGVKKSVEKVDFSPPRKKG